MRLIDADAMRLNCSIKLTDEDARKLKDSLQKMFDDAPTVDAVPIRELRELLNKLYEEDAITFRGLYEINHLIGNHLKGKTDENINRQTV